MNGVFALQSTQIDEWWPVIAPIIERCQKTQFEWTSETVRERLKGADAQFWGVMEGNRVIGGFVTQIEIGAGGTIGRVWIVSGDLKDVGMAVYRNAIEPWFIERGCDLITLDGRKGWQKLLPDYDLHSVKLCKKLIADSVH